MGSSPFKLKRSTRAGLYDEKREAIVGMCARMFAESGFDAVVLADVAEALGTSKPLIYYYFKSKEEILGVIHARARDEYFSVLEAVEASPGGAREKLEALYKGYFDVALSDVGRAFAATRGAAAMTATERGHIRDGRRRIMRLMQAAVEEGSLRPLDVEVAEHAAFALLNWFAENVAQKTAAGRRRLAQEVLNMLWFGMAGQAGPTRPTASGRPRTPPR